MIHDFLLHYVILTIIMLNFFELNMKPGYYICERPLLFLTICATYKALQLTNTMKFNEITTNENNKITTAKIKISRNLKNCPRSSEIYT